MYQLSHYDSPLGGMTLASEDGKLIGLWFDGQKYDRAALKKREGEEAAGEEGEPAVLKETKKWLDIYFSGRAPEFTPELQLEGSLFQRAVAEVLLSIPYGATATYGEIAEEAARRSGSARASARAVGGAVGRNSISIIIPCHRVVGAGGKLTGYAGGLERKRRLLALENPAIFR